MIKKFKTYNESIRHLLVGPTEEEIIKWYKNNPDKLLSISYENNNIKGIKTALGEGANNIGFKNIIKKYELDDNGILDMIEYMTPTKQLMLCSNIGFMKGVVRSIDNGADIHADEDYPLRVSIFYGYYDTTKYLLDKGADVNIQDNWCLKNTRGGSILRKLIVQYMDKKVD